MAAKQSFNFKLSTEQKAMAVKQAAQEQRTITGQILWLFEERQKVLDGKVKNNERSNRT